VFKRWFDASGGWVAVVILVLTAGFTLVFFTRWGWALVVIGAVGLLLLLGQTALRSLPWEIKRKPNRRQRFFLGHSAEPAESLRVLFRGPMDAAVRSLGDVAAHVANAAGARGGLGRQAEYLLQKLNSDLGSAHSATLKCVETGAPLAELQENFVVCFRAYQELIHPVRDTGDEVAYAWADDGNYVLWKRNDEEFLRSLNELTLRSAFTELRPRVTAHMWPQGGRREYWG
jgi:hypothetical protein